MEDQMTYGTKILNGFLSVMVVVLVLILVAVVVCLILAGLGFF
ncbi:hypothetical protein [Eudoraea chungangensis]|nr:hypothetical protein [Eudoraea chungangensis]